MGKLKRGKGERGKSPYERFWTNERLCSEPIGEETNHQILIGDERRQLIGIRVLRLLFLSTWEPIIGFPEPVTCEGKV